MDGIENLCEGESEDMRKFFDNLLFYVISLT